MKTKHYGKHSISLGELADLAKEREFVTDDEDKALVCGFECEYDTPSFRVCISTPRLLRLGAKTTNVHADATYKLIWQGYPVLILGFSDADRKMHPVGIAVTMKETHADFKFLFSSIAHGVDLVTSGESVFAPTHLVSDAATAIKNGFTAAFGHPPEKTIMCLAHVVMNMDKQLIRIKDKKTAAALREDITQLQLCPDEDAFYQATTLFLSKWESSNQAFLEYFRGSCIDQNNTWYEGYAPGCPSTNNGLEAVNQTIKR
ncbi:hypothetical protein ACOMHN_012696 [Nucella lapillus]